MRALRAPLTRGGAAATAAAGARGDGAAVDAVDAGAAAGGDGAVDRGVGEGRRVGVAGARRGHPVTTELPEMKANKNALVVANDAVKKQLQDGTKMTDEPPEGLRANLRPAAVLRRQAGLHHQALRVQGAAARLQRHGLRHLEGMARAVPGRVRGGAVQGAALPAPEHGFVIRTARPPLRHVVALLRVGARAQRIASTPPARTTMARGPWT